MLRWDSTYNQVERQANVFAATLLMPLDDFRRQITPRVKPTIDDIGECAERYQVSLTAAALCWLRYTERRSVLVTSRDGFILWSRSSPRALKTGLVIRTANVPPVPVPEASLPAQPDRLNDGNSAVTHGTGVWFNEPCEEIALISDRYDLAISLLHLDDLPSFSDFSEENEENDTYDRMIRRTPGSRWLE